MKKKIVFIPLIVLGALVCFVGLVLVFLTIVEYRPKNIEDIKISSGAQNLELNTTHSILSWNVGYSGLGKEQDFFMDGGKSVRPSSKKIVLGYLDGIVNTLKENDSEIIFLQEVDVKSKRSRFINEYKLISQEIDKNGAFAYNFNSFYIPYPMPTMGKVESGLVVLQNYNTLSAHRRSLPLSFKWPSRIANLKRCILAERIPVYENGVDTGKELVIANFHLEAYDSGEGKIAQTKVLMEFLNAEYEKGNYVIAGGDFNQSFPGSTNFGVVWPDGWLPAQLDADSLNEGWSFVYDDSKPTCRSLERPYIGKEAEEKNWQYYVIDGFIISPNVEKISMNVIDKNFEHSDHNPVKMEFKLK